MNPLYILMVSVHGLIRGHDLELGRDADTGGQTLYAVELARALAELPGVARVDLMTRRVVDPHVGPDYAEPIEALGPKARIVRIDVGPEGYIRKEELWDHLDSFADNALALLRAEGLSPDIVHSHYADAGYVGTRLANLLGLPLVHTGHSLGRVKRRRLIAAGVKRDVIEARYHMARRVEAEELTLGSASLVIASTANEIEEQYGLYDHYQPEQMRVIPEFPVVTRESRRNSRKTTWLPRHRKMKPFPATAPQEKSHVRNWRSKGQIAPLMRPTKFPEIPVSLERNTEVFRHPLL